MNNVLNEFLKIVLKEYNSVYKFTNDAIEPYLNDVRLECIFYNLINNTISFKDSKNKELETIHYTITLKDYNIDENFNYNEGSQWFVLEIYDTLINDVKYIKISGCDNSHEELVFDKIEQVYPKEKTIIVYE